ncbi:MAG TPA: acyltransferase [Solirubrobacteraceae bacterium]|nr:acyltransferase [Solirubrobacteraceae bacterium]
MIVPKHPDVRSRKWGWYANILAASPLVHERDRARIYRWLGLQLHSDCVKPGCFFQSSRFTLGAGSSVNYGCFVENVAPVEIGENTAVGFQVRIITSSHEPGELEQAWGEWTPTPVRIGSGCWIGAGATILPGVTIGDGCLVAAGAVVTRDCAPHGMYAGVPAQRIRDVGASSTAGVS